MTRTLDHYRNLAKQARIWKERQTFTVATFSQTPNATWVTGNRTFGYCIHCHKLAVQSEWWFDPEHQDGSVVCHG